MVDISEWFCLAHAWRLSFIFIASVPLLWHETGQNHWDFSSEFSEIAKNTDLIAIISTNSAKFNSERNPYSASNCRHFLFHVTVFVWKLFDDAETAYCSDAVSSKRQLGLQSGCLEFNVSSEPDLNRTYGKYVDREGNANGVSSVKSSQLSVSVIPFEL